MHYLHRGLMDGHSDIYIPFVYKHMKEICVGSQVHQIYTYLSNGSVWKLMVIAFFLKYHENSLPLLYVNKGYCILEKCTCRVKWMFSSLGIS